MEGDEDEGVEPAMKGRVSGTPSSINIGQMGSREVLRGGLEDWRRRRLRREGAEHAHGGTTNIAWELHGGLF